jgi:hypothetical protein
MNKLELINEQRDECQISNKEAATIIDFLKLIWPQKGAKSTKIKFQAS